jgi:hypothetical protein
MGLPKKAMENQDEESAYISKLQTEIKQFEVDGEQHQRKANEAFSEATKRKVILDSIMSLRKNSVLHVQKPLFPIQIVKAQAYVKWQDELQFFFHERSGKKFTGSEIYNGLSEKLNLADSKRNVLYTAMKTALKSMVSKKEIKTENKEGKDVFWKE